ncbi:hypothetical protein LJC48_06875 [Desulfovibrio sp. OttesenSCG-928-C06]|nr:hypothetical protein [Desulfovibrio sp. OttesenSCG-928-C06]
MNETFYFYMAGAGYCPHLPKLGITVDRAAGKVEKKKILLCSAHNCVISDLRLFRAVFSGVCGGKRQLCNGFTNIFELLEAPPGA